MKTPPKPTDREIQAQLNNLILLVAQKIGADRLNEIGPSLGEYFELFAKPLVEHVEDEEIAVLDDETASLGLLTLALLHRCRISGSTKGLPALSVAAQMFRQKKGK